MLSRLRAPARPHSWHAHATHPCLPSSRRSLASYPLLIRLADGSAGVMMTNSLYAAVIAGSLAAAALLSLSQVHYRARRHTLAAAQCVLRVACLVVGRPDDVARRHFGLMNLSCHHAPRFGGAERRRSHCAWEHP